MSVRHPLDFRFFVFRNYLFEDELKLGCIQKQLEQNFGIVFGVVDDLFFDLTQSLVVWIIRLKEKKKKNKIRT